MSRGHDKDKVLFQYSIQEVMLFAKAAVQNQRLELVDLLCGMRMATHSKNEGFQKYVGSLLGKRSVIRNKRSSRADINKLKQLGANTKRLAGKNRR